MNIIFPLFIFSLLQFTSPSPVRIPLKLVKGSVRNQAPVNKLLIPSRKLGSLTLKDKNKLINLAQYLKGHVVNLDQDMYVAEIKIGENDQVFNVILDTGSEMLWIPKKGSEDEFEILHHYDPDLSSSSIDSDVPFEVTYGTAYVEGNYFGDVVKFMSDKPFEMLFGAATKTSLKTPGTDGIMGLARSYLVDGLNPILQMREEGIVPSKGFSFKYYKEENYAEMFIGEEHQDFRNEENVASCPLLSRTAYDISLWDCKLYTMSIFKTEKNLNFTAVAGYSTLFDTGTNAIMAPKSILKDLNGFLEAFNCFTVDEEEYTFVLCNDTNNLPDLNLEVGDYYLTLEPSTTFTKYEIEDGVLIDLFLVFFIDLDQIIVGSPFLQAFHTRFDDDNKVLKFAGKGGVNIKNSWKKPPNDEAIDIPGTGFDWNWDWDDFDDDDDEWGHNGGWIYPNENWNDRVNLADQNGNDGNTNDWQKYVDPNTNGNTNDWQKWVDPNTNGNANDWQKWVDPRNNNDWQKYADQYTNGNVSDWQKYVNQNTNGNTNDWQKYVNPNTNGNANDWQKYANQNNN